jgi:hypothetical protein
MSVLTALAGFNVPIEMVVGATGRTVMIYETGGYLSRQTYR